MYTSYGNINWSRKILIKKWGQKRTPKIKRNYSAASVYHFFFRFELWIIKLWTYRFTLFVWGYGPRLNHIWNIRLWVCINQYFSFKNRIWPPYDQTNFFLHELDSEDPCHMTFDRRDKLLKLLTQDQMKTLRSSGNEVLGHPYCRDQKWKWNKWVDQIKEW